MKISRLFLLLCLIPIIALWGCEGDQGPAGVDGSDGVDGVDGVNGYTPAMCLDCHNNAADLEIQLAYAQSGHKAGEYVSYAGGRSSCARCHSKQGFIEFTTMGSVSGNISDPAPLDCAGCHIVHPNPDAFDVRATDPVAWIFDEDDGATTVDFGDDSTLCANCHQSRRGEPALTNPGEDTFEITSTHWGPHHGAQANVLAGVGFAEIDGTTVYPASNIHSGATCIGCHMGTYAEGAGGHSWHPTIDPCNACHDDHADFDRNGYQTEMQVLLDELRDNLIALEVVEYVEEDEAYEPIPGTYATDHARAFFNWIGLEEDRSKGVHNPGYFNALLENSIEATAAK